MNYLSVCSGIEAASSAWHKLGWKPIAFSEIEPFPSAVLKHHYPHVPNLGDMTKFHDWPDFKSTPIDLLVGGTPCQAFSVAGLREGLNDPRGNLTLTFLGVAAKYRPKYIVWENVPGVLSDRTNAFGQFLAGLAQLGYGWAYRVLDAQFFGLAQRRKRVFVVGYLGDWSRAAEILSLGDGLFGHPAPSRETRQEVAGTLSARTKGGGGLGTDFDLAGGVVADGGGVRVAEIAPTLNAHFGDKQGLENQHIDGGAACLLPPEISHCLNAGAMGRLDYETETLLATRRGGFFDDAPTHTLRAEGFDASEDGTGRGTPLVAIPILEAGARTGKSTTDIRAGSGIGDDGDPMFTLQRGKQHGVVVGHLNGTDLQDGKGIARSLSCQERGQPDTVIAFGAKGSGGDAQQDLPPTLRAAGHDKSHANGGSMPAVAFNWNAQVDQMNFDPNTTPALTRSQEAAIGPVAFDTGNQTVNREVFQTLRNPHGTFGDGLPAVAFSENQRSEVALSDVAQALNKGGGKPGQGYPAIHVGMAVRRLTPTECERLQGFTTWIERVVINLCFDHQNLSACAEIKCLRSPSSALLAAGEGRQGTALSADSVFWRNRDSNDCAVAAHVRLRQKPELRALLSAGRSILPASGAAESSLCLQLTQLANSVQESALRKLTAGRLVAHGKVESQKTTICFTAQESGSLFAGIFGRGQTHIASVAENTAPTTAMSTISSGGQNPKNSGLSDQTSLCSALLATGSFIQHVTPNASSVSFVWDIESDHTDIPWRKKMAPDGPRYKSLGNSMAVPCMEWIGRGIELVEKKYAAPEIEWADEIFDVEFE